MKERDDGLKGRGNGLKERDDDLKGKYDGLKGNMMVYLEDIMV